MLSTYFIIDAATSPNQFEAGPLTTRQKFKPPGVPFNKPKKLVTFYKAICLLSRNLTLTYLVHCFGSSDTIASKQICRSSTAVIVAREQVNKNNNVYIYFFLVYITLIKISLWDKKQTCRLILWGHLIFPWWGMLGDMPTHTVYHLKDSVALQTSSFSHPYVRREGDQTLLI